MKNSARKSIICLARLINRLRCPLLPLTAAVLCLTSCSGIFFYPQRTLRLKPIDVGLRYEDVALTAADGTSLHSWYLPAKGEAWLSVLFLHGNAENISTHIGSVYWLPSQGVNVFLLEYRGYGESEGTPGISGIHQDIEAGLDYLCQRSAKEGIHTAVFAQSIGGALAIPQLAKSAHRDCVSALIADSAFSSFRAIVRDKLNDIWLTWPLQYPLSFLIPDADSPLDAVAQISPIPLLVIHGTGDPIVPFNHSELLFAAAKQPKELWLVPQALHIGSLTAEARQKQFLAYLRLHSSPPVP